MSNNNKFLLLPSALSAAVIICCCCCFAGSITAQGLPTVPIRAELRLHPFSNISTPDYDQVDGATVRIDTNFVPGKDKLLYNFESSYNLDSTFDSEKGVLYLSGWAPISEYIDAVSLVAFYTSSDDFNERRVVWTLGRGTFYNVLTRHFYRFAPAPGGKGSRVAWTSARYNCGAEPFLGMQGYLATVTSLEEQTLISTKTNMSLWIGLWSDGVKDQFDPLVWRWADGPPGEANKTQWVGPSMYEGGVARQLPSGPAYTAWGRFQPENYFIAGTDAKYVAVFPSEHEPNAWWMNKAETDGIQGWVCEYGGLNDTPELVRRQQGWFGAVVLEFSCSMYTTSNECTNRKEQGCQWSGSACVMTTCKQYLTEKSCESNFRCRWETDIEATEVGRCSATRCGGLANQESCEADPSCAAVQSYGSLKCLDAKCSDKYSSDGCAMVDDCVWQSAVCDSVFTIGCNYTDTVFLLDGSDAMDQPFLTYSGGWQGLTDIFMRASYSGTRTTSLMTPIKGLTGQRLGFLRYSDGVSYPGEYQGSGGWLTGDNVQIQEDIRFLQQGYAPVRARSIKDAVTRAVEMFRSPDGANRDRVLVIVAAGPIDDANDADVQNMLLSLRVNWGVNVFGVALRPTNPQTLASRLANASLAKLTNVIVEIELDDFLDTVIYGICDHKAYLGSFFAAPLDNNTLCALRTDPIRCFKLPACGWSYASNRCERSHCLQYKINDCENDPTCKWEAAALMCKEKCAGNMEGTCKIYSSMCHWTTVPNVTSECLTFPCMANPTEDACIADPYGCQYNKSATIKCSAIPCEFADRDQCLAHAVNGSCAMYKGVCFMDPCKNISRQRAVCDANHFCEFTGLQDGCQLTPCAAKGSEKECNGDFMCSWNVDVSPPACTAALCTGFNKKMDTAASNCATMPDNCRYQKSVDGSVPRCEVLECGMMKSSCDCAKMPQCVWRNDQCKDSRYVQCPAIDVVFLVEGSSIMSEPFGRHPNGFIGIMESVRSWSRDAPMTSNASLTGFRFGVIVYGAKNTAYTIPDADGRIPGNDVTGDKNTWLGVDGFIDTVEAAQSGYQKITVGTSKAGILDGLKKANDIFKNHVNEDRIKLLVVMGNRPIEGNDDVRQEIVRMEQEYGVKIFSNVIRRFSYITPGDLYTRMFNEPLASDPPSVHFLFTTVDDMRKTLLDEFCDPSSNTGKLLQISRDRTLPCNWLEGKMECNMQATCYWNASAAVTCPLPSQCPNMGCVALPATLANKFQCSHCSLVSGSFICSRASYNKPQVGLCLSTDCLANCDKPICNVASSTTTPGKTCGWSDASSRCELNFCPSYTDWASCNADNGCVWDNIMSPPGCRRSLCWANRAVGSCEAGLDTDNYPNCAWLKLLSPAVCQERRCPSLIQTSCTNDYPKQCRWNIGSPRSTRKCETVECDYIDGERCELDKLCYWNPYTNLCLLRKPDCVISNFGPFTQCTSNCGPKAIRISQRKIIQYPDAVAGATGCAQTARGMNPPGMLQVQQCSISVPMWPTNCPAYCLSKGTQECINDMSCMWVGQSCAPRPQLGCDTKTTESDCKNLDMCYWDPLYNFCLSTVTTCRFRDPDVCGTVKECLWRRGTNTRGFASGLGIYDTTLFNPGQRPVFVFPLIAFDQTLAQTRLLDGATVVIEQGYARGKDFLDLSIPSFNIDVRWDPTRGALFLTTKAGLGVNSSASPTVADYGNALHFVTFETTSHSGAPRLITWSLGADTVYSGVTQHHYKFYGTAQTSWGTARAMCGASTLFGKRGYLATVTTQEENDVIATKLGGIGWLGADDTKTSQWRWSDGPDGGRVFWVGGCQQCGGQTVPGLFANWDPLMLDPLPALIPAESHVYMNMSGFWHSRHNDYPESEGYVCEFGGDVNDVPTPFPVGGATVFGPGGCMATPCTWHSTQGNCSADPDCQWSGFGCQTGCGSRSTVSSCTSSERCFWKTDVLPPLCATNPCAFLGKDNCDSQNVCKWDKVVGYCMLRTGCAAESTEVACDRLPLCQWSATEVACISRPCDSVLDQTSCSLNPTCLWVGGNCLDSVCMHPDSASCQADTKCEWLQPNVISVGFVPAQDAVHIFENLTTSSVPRDSSTIIDGITVRIKSGFQIGDDKLFLDRTPFTSSIFRQVYLDTAGVLLLYAFPSAQLTADKAYEFMQRFVSFQTTSKRRAPRDISYVLSADSVFSDGSSSYFKYVRTKVQVASAAQALAVCQRTPLFNLQGRLAAPMAERDNLALAAVGAQGWFGGSATNGIWNWAVTNQWYTKSGNVSVLQSATETINFWNFANGYGSPVPSPDANSINRFRYAAWSADEPVAPASTTAVQRTFMLPGGKWVAVVDGSDTGLLPGVICQYGSVNMTTATTVQSTQQVTPRGCFPTRCTTLGETLCRLSTQCVWRSRADGSGFCSLDSWCAAEVPVALTLEICKSRETCYWDYESAFCATAPDSPCQKIKNQTQCEDPTIVRGCTWNSNIVPKPGIIATGKEPVARGACTAAGCSRHPFASTCGADPLCRWYQPSAVLGAGVCIERLCGSVDVESCYNDRKCQWSSKLGRCTPSVCLGKNDVCSTLSECELIVKDNLCAYKRCSANMNAADGRFKCLSDPSCLINSAGTCYMPDCKKYVTEASCNADTACHFFITKGAGGLVNTRCDAAQCTMNSDKATCGGTSPDDPCRWDPSTGKCRQASASEMQPQDLCIQEIDGNLWWMYVLIGLIVLFLGLIIWRLWVAYDKGLSFLDPPRKSQKFDLSMYAADMFEDAQHQDEGEVEGGGSLDGDHRKNEGRNIEDEL